jgi:hypothetical protein
MERICTYIDLLGFSNYVNADVKDALLLLENYESILQIGFTASDEYKTFVDFLPCSDSIFILGNKRDCNEFITEISNFFVECFLFTAHAYSHPIEKSKPTKVITPVIGYNLEEKDVEVKPIERNWYPTLFKGGITCGDVETFTQKALYKRESIDQRNFAGKGIVTAVALENSGRGPHLFCNNAIIELLDEKTREKYVIGNNTITEILWPIKVFVDQNEPKREIENGYAKLMRPAINLWKSYENTPIAEIYFNLMKLITISAIRYAEIREIETEFLTYLKQYLKKHKILHFYDSLKSN